MPNIIRSTTNDKPAVTTPTPTPTDPFQRLVRDMLRWDPFREMAPIFQPSEVVTFAPAFEVKETKDSYLFKADLPGVKDKDIDVKLEGTRLTISGKREAEHEDKSDTYYTFERSYGSFLRSFTLPDGIDGDHVQADLKEGVLTVAVPKRAGEKAKTIAIKSGAKS